MPNEQNPFDTHDWTPDTLEPRCRRCGCRLIIPYGDIAKEAGEPCPFVVELLAADKQPPEASFDNVGDMLAYLNDTPPHS